MKRNKLDHLGIDDVFLLFGDPVRVAELPDDIPGLPHGALLRVRPLNGPHDLVPAIVPADYCPRVIPRDGSPHDEYPTLDQVMSRIRAEAGRCGLACANVVQSAMFHALDSFGVRDAKGPFTPGGPGPGINDEILLLGGRARVEYNPMPVPGLQYCEMLIIRTAEGEDVIPAVLPSDCMPTVIRRSPPGLQSFPRQYELVCRIDALCDQLGMDRAEAFQWLLLRGLTHTAKPAPDSAQSTASSADAQREPQPRA